MSVSFGARGCQPWVSPTVKSSASARGAKYVMERMRQVVAKHQDKNDAIIVYVNLQYVSMDELREIKVRINGILELEIKIYRGQRWFFVWYHNRLRFKC